MFLQGSMFPPQKITAKKERFLFAIGLWRSLENVYFYTARTVTTESTWEGDHGKTWKTLKEKTHLVHGGFFGIYDFFVQKFEPLDGLGGDEFYVAC